MTNKHNYICWYRSAQLRHSTRQFSINIRPSGHKKTLFRGPASSWMSGKRQAMHTYNRVHDYCVIKSNTAFSTQTWFGKNTNWASNMQVKQIGIVRGRVES